MEEKDWDQESIIICVYNDYKNESEEHFFQRKIEEIKKFGYTLWFDISYLARCEKIQELGKNLKKKNLSLYCIFISVTNRKNKREPPNKSTQYFSSDNKNWDEIPKGLHFIKGNAGHAFVIEDLIYIPEKEKMLNLWNYVNYFDQSSPILFKQSGTTICASKKDSSKYPKKPNTNLRNIIAIAKLKEPFAVWLK